LPKFQGDTMTADLTADTPTAPTCSQCGKTAIGKVGDLPICIDCYTKLQTTNLVVRTLESIAGVRPGLFPRIQIPPLPSAPFTLNNIKIDNSVVGAINTGNVQTIDVSLSYLHQGGNDKARDALKALTEAILGASSIDHAQKNELLEQVAFLSEQAVAGAKDRKPGVIKATLGAVSQAAGSISAVAGAWQVAEPILSALFNF
jgi:hypothetical protein